MVWKAAIVDVNHRAVLRARMHSRILGIDLSYQAKADPMAILQRVIVWD